MSAVALNLGVIDWRQLNHQRAALLAAIGATKADSIADGLEGVLNLLDELCDAAADAGLYSGEEQRRWWSEGCALAGMPVDDAE